MGLVTVFPCHICGHVNKPKKKDIERVMMFIKGELPICIKCGARLTKDKYDRSSIPAQKRMDALKELGFPKEIVKCPRCPQQLRVPTDIGRLNAKCPKCLTVFDFDP